MHRPGLWDLRWVCLVNCQLAYTRRGLLTQPDVSARCGVGVHSSVALSTSCSCFSFFSIFLRSRVCSQLSLGTNPSLSLYSFSACMNWPMPPMLGVWRFSGAWSEGSTQRSGGRGAKSWSSIGGSLSVISTGVASCALGRDVG